MSPPSRLALLLMAAAMPAMAQYTAKKIVFNHPGPYTQEQLEGATGMHVAMTFTAGDLGASAQRLVDSGYFDGAGATLEGKTNAASVLFDIKPIERSQMLHVGYENFAWLSHEEIESAIHAKSPLFADYLPESSPIADSIEAALTEALAAKNVTAQVTHDTIEPTMQKPERVLEFRILKPAIRVANVKLGGITPELAPLLQKSINAATKSAFNEGLAGQTTQERILQPLLDAGYVHASLDAVTREPSPIADGAVSVALSATLDTGEIFHVSDITFAGTPLLPAEAFAASQKLHTGDIASRKQLLETLTPLDAAYRKQGYMDVVIKATPTTDMAAHQIAYNVTVTPGEQYRMHEITVNGLDPGARKEFDRGFLMKAGELYSPEYVAEFIKNNTALQTLAPYSGSFKAYADPNTHTVDLVVTFFRVHGR